MTVTVEVTGVVTNAGIAAAVAAGKAGPQINVNGYRIGGNSAEQGAVALVTDTDVDGLVYQGGVADMSYSVVNPDTVVWRIRLDSTVGNFKYGNVGLVLQDGTLFCKAVMPAQDDKYQSSGVSVGNNRYINILLRLTNQASLINLSFIDSLDCNLPEVADETRLPDPATSTFDVYLVDNHTHVGVPTTAARFNDAWWHASHRFSPGQGQGVIVATPADFAISATDAGGAIAPALGAVGFDAVANQFVAADSDSAAFGPIGVRTSAFEITVLGTVPGALAGVTGSLTPHAFYYAGGASAGTIGHLSTVQNGPPIAVATSATDLWIDCTRLWMGDTDADALMADELAVIVLNARKRIQNERFDRALSERSHYRDLYARQRLTAAGL